MFAQKINDQLGLRMLKVKEASKLFSLTDQNRHDLQKWLPWVDRIQTVKDASQFVKDSFESFARLEDLNCGLFYKKELVGMISYNNFDWDNNIGELGYWLSDDYQGKGFMTKAVQTFIKYGFVHFKLNKIEIHTATENIKSQAIPSRLNFKKEGRIRAAELIHGRYVDHFVYGLLRKDWRNSQMKEK